MVVITVFKRDRIQESNELLCYAYNMNLILKLLTILPGVEETGGTRNAVQGIELISHLCPFYV